MLRIALATLLLVIYSVPGKPHCSTAAGGDKGKESVSCSNILKQKKVKYRIAHRSRANDGSLILNISISKKEFTRDRLLHLSCQLSADWARESSVSVAIYDSYESASRYFGPWQPEKPAGWKGDEASLRAYYLRDPAQGVHRMVWYSDPAHKKGKTSVDLK